MEKILVVDDEPTVLNLCRRILQLGGYEAVLAGNGEEALRQAASLGYSIDLALLDVVMPGMNGIEVARRLQASKPELPILLMTGYGPKEIALIVGEHPYRIIWKPFKTDSLLRMIDNAFGRSADNTTA